MKKPLNDQACPCDRDQVGVCLFAKPELKCLLTFALCCPSSHQEDEDFEVEDVDLDWFGPEKLIIDAGLSGVIFSEPVARVDLEFLGNISAHLLAISADLNIGLCISLDQRLMHRQNGQMLFFEINEGILLDRNIAPR